MDVEVAESSCERLLEKYFREGLEHFHQGRFDQLLRGYQPPFEVVSSDPSSGCRSVVERVAAIFGLSQPLEEGNSLVLTVYPAAWAVTVWYVLTRFDLEGLREAGGASWLIAIRDKTGREWPTGEVPVAFFDRPSF